MSSRWRRGLQHAHENGIVHRDIKPGNLILDRQGVVKILDMGLARFSDARKDNLTRRLDEGAVLGTTDYIAPEQALSSDVDIRADIYSLGGTLYTLLAGRTPYEGKTTTQKLLAHQLRAVDDLSKIRKDIPRPLVGVVETMMAKRLEDRYQTPAEVLAALAPWIPTSISPVSSVRLSPPVLESSADRPETKAKPARKNRWPVAVAAGIVTLVVAVGISWGLLANSRPPAAVQTDIPPTLPAEVEMATVPPVPRVEPAKAGEKVVYRLDLSRQSPFEESLTGKVSSPATATLSGWERHRWADGGSTSYGVEETDRGRALSLSHTGPLGGGMWLLLVSTLREERRNRLEIEYRTEGRADCVVRFKLADQTVADIAPLASTGGKWKSVSIEVPAGGSRVAGVELQNPIPGAENRLLVRQFALVDAGPRSEERLVAQQNWADVGDLRLTMKHFNPVEKTGELPSDWQLMAWKDDGVVEARRETVQDRPVLAIRQVEGAPSAMLFWKLGRVRADRQYRLRILYRAQGGSRTYLKVREDDKEAKDIAALPDTWNQWARREVPIVPTIDGLLQLEFHPILAKPDQVWQLASVELVEVAKR